MNLYEFYSYKLIGKLTAFFAASGVQLAQDNRGGFHYRRAAFSSLMKAKRGEDSVAGALLDCRIHLASREGENT